MKFIITPLLLFAVMWANPAVAHAPTEPVQPTVEEYAEKTKSELISIVDELAAQYGVSAYDMKRVINCESGWQPEIQSQHTYTVGQAQRNPQWGIVAGEQERSFGLVQIHLPAHPTVEEYQATDPYFAIEFMAYWFSQGKQSWWTCY